MAFRGTVLLQLCITTSSLIRRKLCMRTCIIPAAKEAHPRTTPRCSRSIGRNRMGRSIGSTIKPASFCKEPLSLLPAAARLRQVLVLARHETSVKFYQKRQSFIQLVGDHWFYVLVVQKLVDLLSFANPSAWKKNPEPVRSCCASARESLTGMCMPRMCRQRREKIASRSAITLTVTSGLTACKCRIMVLACQDMQ